MCLLIFNSHRPHHDVKFEKYVVTFLFENVVVAMASYIGRVQSNSILVCKPSNNKCMLKWMHNEYQRIMLCCVVKTFNFVLVATVLIHKFSMYPFGLHTTLTKSQTMC